MTHDYKRHGTTTLFAALNVLDGTAIAQNMQRHRHQEFIRFLNRIEREVAADKAIHVILDNYAAHKQDKVRAWLDRHPRWTFHFTPTSCSWLKRRRGLLRQTHPAQAQARRLPFRCRSSRPPSTASPANTMPRTRNHSSGKPTPMISSPPETAGSKRWNQSTSLHLAAFAAQDRLGSIG